MWKVGSTVEVRFQVGGICVNDHEQTERKCWPNLSLACDCLQQAVADLGKGSKL